MDREKIINGLHEMSCRATWEDIDRSRNKFQPIINGAISLLKEQDERIKTLEHQLETITKWRANAGAFD